MFDTITVYGLEVSGGPDFGLLAESLLFYGHVQLVVNAARLKALLRVCGYETVRDLMNMNALSLVYLENGVGVRTTDGGRPCERHDFIVFDSPVLRLQNCLPEVLRELVGKEGRARRLAEQLKRHVSISRHPQTINDTSLEDVATSSYVRAATARVIRYLAPEYQVPDPFIFDVVRDGQFVRVSTNIDFAALNLTYHRHVDRRDSTVTPAYLLSTLHEATAELKIAASARSEMALSPVSARIADTRLSRALGARLQSEMALQIFQEFVFDDSRAIREAVNCRHRNMAEVAALVAEAQKFKGWIRDQPEDADMRRAYLAEVGKLGWCDKLPRRSARWAIFTAAGVALSSVMAPAAGAIAGAALSAIDYFLVDKLAQGWRPNQFVEGPLREFLQLEEG
jgi:hypothetical protein